MRPTLPRSPNHSMPRDVVRSNVGPPVGAEGAQRFLAMRKIMDWAMRDHVRIELTLAALLTVIRWGRLTTRLIHH
jgi:hypothetical protein